MVTVSPQIYKVPRQGTTASQTKGMVLQKARQTLSSFRRRSGKGEQSAHEPLRPSLSSLPAQQHISARSLGAATGAEYRTGSSFLAGYRQPPQRPPRRTMLLLSLPAWLLRQSGPCYGKRQQRRGTAYAERGSRPLNPPRIETGQGRRAATLCLLLASARAGEALQANRKPSVCVISS